MASELDEHCGIFLHFFYDYEMWKIIRIFVLPLMLLKRHSAAEGDFSGEMVVNTLTANTTK